MLTGGIVIFTVCITMLIATVLYSKFGYFKKFFHDFLRWHEPEDHWWWDGSSVHSRCKHCGKEITRDSQGNWF